MSYPLNFGIYCGMSQQFRDTFKEFIPTMCKGRRNNRNDGDVRSVSKPRGHRRPKNQNKAGTGNQVK